MGTTFFYREHQVVFFSLVITTYFPCLLSSCLTVFLVSITSYFSNFPIPPIISSEFLAQNYSKSLQQKLSGFLRADYEVFPQRIFSKSPQQNISEWAKRIKGIWIVLNKNKKKPHLAHCGKWCAIWATPPLSLFPLSLLTVYRCFVILLFPLSQENKITENPSILLLLHLHTFPLGFRRRSPLLPLTSHSPVISLLELHFSQSTR